MPGGCSPLLATWWPSGHPRCCAHPLLPGKQRHHIASPNAGKHVLDYAPNPLKPRLAVEGGDYLFFADMAPKDRVYVDCEAQGDILFCPGSPVSLLFSGWGVKRG